MKAIKNARTDMPADSETRYLRSLDCGQPSTFWVVIAFVRTGANATDRLM